MDELSPVLAYLKSWGQYDAYDRVVAARDRIDSLTRERDEARSLLSVALCSFCDGRGWYVEPGHACRNEQECMERCPEPVQVQCEWCDRRRAVLDTEEVGDREG